MKLNQYESQGGKHLWCVVYCEKCFCEVMFYDDLKATKKEMNEMACPRCVLLEKRASQARGSSHE